MFETITWFRWGQATPEGYKRLTRSTRTKKLHFTVMPASDRFQIYELQVHPRPGSVIYYFPKAHLLIGSSFRRGYPATNSASVSGWTLSTLWVQYCTIRATDIAHEAAPWRRQYFKYVSIVIGRWYPAKAYPWELEDTPRIIRRRAPRRYAGRRTPEELFEQLNARINPGITLVQFRLLFVRCECGIVTTRRAFSNHGCRARAIDLTGDETEPWV